MKAIDEFYAAWDAASEVAVLEGQAMMLRQIAEIIDDFKYTGKSQRRFWDEVRFLTDKLRRSVGIWKEQVRQYHSDKARVDLGMLSEKKLPKTMEILKERPVIRNPYQGLRNAAKDQSLAARFDPDHAKSKPNPRQRRDIDPKNLSPDVRARLYPDWQPKPRKSRNKPGTVD
jgi:hypothetical protein